MKSILISIKPKWVVKILNGEKTVEIRKTMPKCDLPIDVYIYCTKEDNLCCIKKISRDRYICGKDFDIKDFPQLSSGYDGNGKVVAKFTLNKVDEYNIQHPIFEQHSIYKNKEYHGELETSHNDIVDKGCISPDLVQKYLDLDELEEGTLFGWHISNLEIFDKPKELSEFYRIVLVNKLEGYEKPLIKSPQSWQFVEVLE